MENYSLTQRIDNIALAYVSSKFDVSKMSIDEFLEEYKKACNAIAEKFTLG